jgi:hypothetical protein
MAGGVGDNWRVVDMQQSTRVSPSGKFEDVYEWTVETAWGGAFKITLPVAGYTPDALQRAAEAEYTQLTNGRFLSG